MIKKSLILVFVVLTAIIWSGNSFASQNFRKFDINDYPKDKISTHELLTQVRDFSINIRNLQKSWRIRETRLLLH